MIGNRILVADVTGNVAEQLWKLSLKSREVGTASGHRRERAHLVIALQIIHLSHRNAHTVRIAAISGMRFTILAHDESDADGEDSYIFCVFDLLHDLVERQLAESVHPGRH